MKNPRILKGSIYHYDKPDEGNGGAAVAEPIKSLERLPELGSAFSKMNSDMGDEPAPEPVKETPKEPAAKVDEPKKDEAKPKKGGIEDALSPSDDAKPKLEGSEVKEPAGIEDETKGMSEAAKTNWKTLRSKYEGEIEQLKSEVTKLKTGTEKTSTEVQAKLDALQRERDEMAGVLEKIGVERSPQFREKFVKGREGLIARAASLVEKFGGQKDSFLKAQDMPAREQAEALDESLANLTDFQRQQIASIMTNVASLDDEREQFLSKSKENLSAFEREQMESAVAENAKIVEARKQRFNEVVSSIIRPLPEDHPLAAETNPMVAEVQGAAAQFLFENSDFDKFAEAAVAFAVRPKLMQRISALSEENEKLKASIAELSSSQTTGAHGSGGGGPSKEHVGSFSERFQKAADGLGKE